MTTPQSYAETTNAQLIADYVSSGETLVDACKWLGVDYFSIFKRLRNDAPFAELMDAARLAGADVIASNNRRIMRGEEGYSTGDWKRDRFLIDTNFKLLAKWHPKQYGEKLQIESNTRSVAIPPSDDPIAAQKAYEQLMKGD